MRSDTRRLHFAVGLARSLSCKKRHWWSASSLLKHIRPSTPRQEKVKLRDWAGGNQKWAFAHLRGFPPPTLEPECCRVTEAFTSHNQGLIAIKGKLRALWNVKHVKIGIVKIKLYHLRWASSEAWENKVKETKSLEKLCLSSICDQLEGCCRSTCCPTCPRIYANRSKT